MKMRMAEVAYCDGSLKFSLRKGRPAGIIENASPAKRSARAVLKESLGAEVRARLCRLFKDKRRLLVVVPDLTRKAHLRDILPEVLRIPSRACKVGIVAATGLHLPHSGEELMRLVGREICKRYNVFSHTQEKTHLADFGRTRSGHSIVLNRCLNEYDSIISVGVIEPHLYAGFSGGAKTIAIGLAGEAVINSTHHPRFLDDKRVGLGMIRGNPFQDLLWDIAKRFPVVFSVNVVNDSRGNALRIFAGGMRDVFQKGVEYARRVYGAKVGGKAKVVIAGVGYPKDSNLYQASRAMNYILDSGSSILEEGGFLILAAELRDGLGGGIAEKRCFDTLKDVVSSSGRHGDIRARLKSFIGVVKAGGCLGGEHRAYMIARAALKARIILVGERAKEVAEGLPFKKARTIGESR